VGAHECTAYLEAHGIDYFAVRVHLLQQMTARPWWSVDAPYGTE
jgi:hypothetical protein